MISYDKGNSRAVYCPYFIYNPTRIRAYEKKLALAETGFFSF